MTQTFLPSQTYGSKSIKNRVRPGGDLGSKQYYFTTNAKTGEITVNRYNTTDDTGVEVAKITQGSKTINVNSDTTSAETSFFSTPSNIAKVRQQALQVARREWDGKTQPPPSQAIYGTNAGTKAFDPAGSGNHATSTKNTQTAAKNAALDTLGAIVSGAKPTDAIKQGLQGFLGGVLKSGSAGGALVYPVAIAGSGQDYIKFQKLKYQGKKRKGLEWDGRDDNRASVGQAIILPIPGGISDTTSASWGGETMGPVDTALANIASSAIEGGMTAGVDEAENIMKDAGKASAEVGEVLKKQIAGMASGTGSQLLTRTTGNIINPNMELLFKNPSLRPFSFTWKLAPRSSDEAQTVIDIIRFFKQGMAPTKSEGTLFLQSPHTWRISYSHRGKENHKYLNKFKECAMQSLTTQYTPDGNYSTFQDGVMTAYSITMSLTELEPVFSNDYKGTDGIGY